MWGGEKKKILLYEGEKRVGASPALMKEGKQNTNSDHLQLRNLNLGETTHGDEQQAKIKTVLEVFPAAVLFKGLVWRV